MGAAQSTSIREWDDLYLGEAVSKLGAAYRDVAAKLTNIGITGSTLLEEISDKSSFDSFWQDYDLPVLETGQKVFLFKKFSKAKTLADGTGIVQIFK